MPQFGATFVPGGYDDYYMPEVIAPSPQRVMPEVPQNMQEDLQRLEQRFSELDASEGRPQQNTSSASANTSPPISGPTAGRHEREPSLSTIIQNGGSGTNVTGGAQTGSGGGATTIPQINEPPAADFKPFKDDDNNSYANKASIDDSMEAPSFSPFPKVKGDNIPPSDDEKEEILYNARQHVLHSNNVSMQLSWARDSLAWVEAASEAAQRESKGRGSNNDRPATPKVEHDLRVDAVNIVQYLSDQGHPEALFMRAKWLEFGKFGYRPDKKEAYVGYRRAGEQGWGRAEYRMGMLYEGSNDMEKAIKHYNRGQEQGDSAASYRLGMMSLLGQHGFRKDYQRGLDLIQVAADSADEDAPQGAYVFGMLISRDLPDLNIPEGILPFNLGLARQYIEKAAYLGFAKAQSKMGQAYELCQLGCDFNPAYSLHYYGLAARQGQPEAALGVSRWFLFGYEGVFAKNEQLAFKYAQQAADAKLATGEFAMGYYYEIGIHMPKDLREARNWYEKASENGNKDAIQRLESLNQSGKTLTKKDHETTALGRIKSQHGSQRGKRPERFGGKTQDRAAAVAAGAMPTLAESAPGTPDEGGPPPLPPSKSGANSPRQHSPGDTGAYDMPDPSRHSTYNNNRPPAFTVNLSGAPPPPQQQQELPYRSKSTAPYPEDDRPPPLTVSGRPKSTAPYPEEDGPPPLSGFNGRGAVSPHYNPQIRNTVVGSPQADRPMSAFGIRPLSPSGRPYPPQGPQQPVGGPGMRQSQSMGSGLAIPPAGTQPPRGRVVSAGPGAVPGWGEPQLPPQLSGYRQASPARQGLYDQPSQGRMPVGGGGPGPGGVPPVGDPTRNRLTKQNPSGAASVPPLQPPYAMSSARPSSSGGGSGYVGPSPVHSPPFSPQQAQPGRDYGPRTSSRPVSDIYGGGQAPLPSQQQQGGQHPPRISSSGYGSPHVGGGGPQFGGGGPGPGGRPQQLKDRPTQMDAIAGRQSAPPMQGNGVGRPSPVPSQAPSVASTSGAPGRKPIGSGAPGAPGAHGAGGQGKNGGKGQGPATFEEMGIPQGKGDDDCCVM